MVIKLIVLEIPPGDSFHQMNVFDVKGGEKFSKKTFSRASWQRHGTLANERSSIAMASPSFATIQASNPSTFGSAILSAGKLLNCSQCCWKDNSSSTAYRISATKKRSRFLFLLLMVNDLRQELFTKICKMLDAFTTFVHVYQWRIHCNDSMWIVAH